MDGLEQIYEPGRQIPVCARTDVVVAGGGVSGCAAALAARRAGSQVILLERNGILGGVATAGLMANIGNHFLDNAGQPVSGGIPLEIVNRLVAIGGASDQWCSREVPGVVVDSERLRYLLGKMLQEEGVTVLTHAPAVRPIVDSGDARGVFIETKTGRGAILAAVVVDATGEADLAFRAGCPMRWEDGTASLEFKMGGANLEALYQHFRNQPETFPVGMDMVKGFTEFERNWVERGIFFFPHGGGRVWDIFQHAIVCGEFVRDRGELWSLDAAGLYGLRGLDTVIVNSNFYTVTSLDTVSLSRATLACEEACYYVADFFRTHVPGFGQANIVQMATDLGIRTSRAIEGKATYTDVCVPEERPVRCRDVIGCALVDVRFADTGRFFAAQTRDIPSGILLPQEIEGLLVCSGKSASTAPLKLLRGMMDCMVLGQAAGAMAAVAARSGVRPAAVPVRDVQTTLLEQGAYLGPRDRMLELGLS